MKDEQPDEFIVPFDRRWLWRFFWTSLVMTPASAGLAVFLTVTRPQASGTGALLLLLMVPASYLIVVLGSGLAWWAGSKLASRTPAFSVDSEGMWIHFAYQPEMRFAWSDVKSVSLKQSGARPESMHLCFDLDPQAYAREAGFLQRWASKLASNGTPVSIGLPLLDRPWTEIEQALNDRAAGHQRAAAMAAMSDEEWEEFGARFRKDLESRLTLDGNLVTYEQYKERFSRRPVGWWTPAGEGFSRSPTDQDIVFHNDNSGFFTDGAFHEPVKFVWREKGECEVELQVGEDSYTVTYEIRDTQPPTLWFTEETGAFAFTLDPYVFASSAEPSEPPIKDAARPDGSE